MKKLDRGEKEEVLEFYDGTFTSIRYLANLFNVSKSQIKWLVNYKNYRKTHSAITMKYYKEIKFIGKKI